MRSGDDLSGFRQREQASAEPHKRVDGTPLEVSWRTATLHLPKSVFACGEPLGVRVDTGEESLAGIELTRLGAWSSMALREVQPGSTDVVLAAPDRPGTNAVELRAYDGGAAYTAAELIIEVTTPAAIGVLRFAQIDNDPAHVPAGREVLMSWEGLETFRLFEGAHIAVVRVGEGGAGEFSGRVESRHTLPAGAISRIFRLPVDPGCVEIRLYDRHWDQDPFRLDTLRCHLVIPLREGGIRAPSRVDVNGSVDVEIALLESVWLGPGAHLFVQESPRNRFDDMRWHRTTGSTYELSEGQCSLRLAGANWLTESGRWLLRVPDRYTGWSVAEVTFEVGRPISAPERSASGSGVDPIAA